MARKDGSGNVYYYFEEPAGRTRTITGATGLPESQTSQRDVCATYQWDAEGRLRSVDNGSTWNATYNALGQQVEKLASTWRMEVLFDPFGKELGTFDGINGLWWQRNITLGTRSTAIYLNNIVRFIHANHLGTTTMVTNGSGACLQDQRFYPWGQQWDSACGQTDLHFASLPQIDASTGLYPTQFRHYYPRLYRWLSPDPMAGDITNPQSLNRYAYVLNNPTNFTDPLGLLMYIPPYKPPDDGNTVDLDPDDYPGNGPSPGSSQEPGGKGGAGGGAGAKSQNLLTYSQIHQLVADWNLSMFCNEMVECIIMKESGLGPNSFNANALGQEIPSQGNERAWGLMQVTRIARDDLARFSASVPKGDELYDPATNIATGTAFLNVINLAYVHGNVTKTLARYGEGRNYAEDVLACTEKLQSGDINGAYNAAKGRW